MIEDSDITNAWRGNSCLVLGNTLGGGQAVDPIVRRNRFHECGSPANGNHDHAIYAANVTGGEIVENLFYNSAAYTVQLYPNAHHTRFAHNVIDGSSPSVRGGVVFGGDRWYASSDNVVEQNVISRAATSAITFYWEGPVGTGNVARNNCVWGSGDRDIAPSRGFRAAGNVIAKPGFVNPGARDYRLRRPSRCLRSVGYDTLSKLLGPAPTARKAPRRRRLRVSLRPRRPATSAERRVAAGRLRRVPIMVRVRGASRGTVRISLRRRWSDSGRWGRPRVSVLHVRGQRRFSLAPRLRAGTYQARARVRDAALSRTAHSRGVRFLVP